ncbi:ESX-1 secretion-associated protein EspK-like [Dysidea avara]|uniref:ESX-1 secretion-associated protein EspK-like n=1 Tax=Dysidea avara TaxID=196820 RepID=UPI00331A15B4
MLRMHFFWISRRRFVEASLECCTEMHEKMFAVGICLSKKLVMSGRGRKQNRSPPPITARRSERRQPPQPAAVPLLSVPVVPIRPGPMIPPRVVPTPVLAASPIPTVRRSERSANLPSEFSAVTRRRRLPTLLPVVLVTPVVSAPTSLVAPGVVSVSPSVVRRVIPPSAIPAPTLAPTPAPTPASALRRSQSN